MLHNANHKSFIFLKKGETRVEVDYRLKLELGAEGAPPASYNVIIPQFWSPMILLIACVQKTGAQFRIFTIIGSELLCLRHGGWDLGLALKGESVRYHG